MKLIILLILLSFSFHGHAKPCIKSIFSFGDSYADSGNRPALVARNLAPGPVISEKSPYGMTFFHHPTGRFCDGRVILDFISQEFGLPLVPPYFAHNGSFKQGANFAVSGATGLDYSFFVKHNITNPNLFNASLNVQLEWFKDLKPSLCNTPKRAFGINDYTIPLFSGKSASEVRTYIPTLVETISKTIETNYEGAQTIVVPGIPPYGCLPVILDVYHSTNKMDYEAQTGCLKKLNEMSRYQNSLILKSVTDLRCKFPRVKIIYANYYDSIIDLLKSPKHLGFVETPLRVCCGVGGEYNFNISKGCGMSGVKSCENPSKYLNWDGAHLTEGAYRYIANGWLKGPFADPPILADVGHL